MKLYLVERTDTVGWDETNAVVVRAASHLDALALLRERLDSGPWLHGIEPDGSNVQIKRIRESGERGVICHDFNAG
ncbi:hypothetical protein [Streptomyces lycii]|uniref:Uncharacterized protein n=1 Tax=Streptomyces lycii TaxID=2654337 RepID=A0ABQ7FJ22_9ACTN|nr:hypothetical protein [Streptomyces lycii]KAF4408632.1 hypothetical protein GCU69_13110 [Streptomyces lycii]